MTEESPSKIKKEKVLKIVDKVSRIFLIILFAYGIYLLLSSAIVIGASQPVQAVLILGLVINSAISLMIYSRMD